MQFPKGMCVPAFNNFKRLFKFLHTPLYSHPPRYYKSLSRLEYGASLHFFLTSSYNLKLPNCASIGINFNAITIFENFGSDFGTNDTGNVKLSQNIDFQYFIS